MTIAQIARDFFDACDSGKGWEACSQYCTPDATFSAQADALAGIDTLEAYTGWMQGVLIPMPNASYEIKFVGMDEENSNACIYGVFTGTHTADGGPVPPTGKTTVLTYAYIMDFEGDKIRHLTKVWNADHSLRELGWA
jgi:predicted ester cyclase